MTRKSNPKTDTSVSDEGRFYEIQQEVAAKARGPYRLTRDIVIQPLTRGQAKKMKAAKTDDEQLAILLGEHLEAVEELYDDRDLAEWAAFQRDLFAHFYGDGAADLPGGSQGS